MANGPTSAETRHLRTLFALGAAGSLTDGQLLERFATRTGDPAELAFAALVERHGPMVLRVARATLGDEHSAHDAFQATFLILARKARSLWVRDSLGPWLHAVAFRVANHSRALEARRRRHEQAASGPEAHDPRDWSRDDLARAIHEEIDRLPEPYRAAIVTCHLEGLTQQEAAHRLGWPLGTLQSRLARGRQRLSDRLKRRDLAPSIAVLAGKLAPVPNALLASTAKAAATIQLGTPIAGMIAPAVLAMIETTTKGMLMTKLKLGAVALAMVCGVIGTGMGLGVGRPVKATDGSKEDVQRGEPVPQAREAEPAATPKPSVPLSATPAPEAVRLASSDVDANVVPRPADGPGFPVLLAFNECTEADIKYRQELERLVSMGYLIKWVDCVRGPGVDLPALVREYEIKAYPTVVLVDGTGAEIARVLATEKSTAAEIAAFYNQNRARPSKKSRGDDEPSLTIPSIPKPWETVVQVKIRLDGDQWIYGSGTIISSTDEESIILTSGDLFRPKGNTLPPAKDFSGPIEVDLFDGVFHGSQPARLGRIPGGHKGEAIDYDLDNDLALIRIRPGRKLAASPVLGPDRQYQKGTRMITVGCSDGQDATAWDTKILDSLIIELDRWARLVCAHRPKAGRWGGGLYTTEGYVAGVCSFTHPDKDSKFHDCGFYATPGSIRKLLDRNGLSRVYEHESTENRGPVTEGSSSVGPTKVDGGGPAIATPMPAPTLAEPVPSRSVSDQDRRPNELERKLDQVLKALEDLKGDKTSDQLKGDFPRKR